MLERFVGAEAETERTCNLTAEMTVPVNASTSAPSLTPDGRKVKAKVSFIDDKFVTVQRVMKEGKKNTKSVRELTRDKLICTMTIDSNDNLKCVQKNEAKEEGKKGFKSTKKVKEVEVEEEKAEMEEHIVATDDEIKKGAKRKKSFESPSD